MITIYQTCLEYAFFTLEVLVRKRETNNDDGVQLCLNFIKRFRNPTKDDIVKGPRVLICCLDFLWQLLIYSDKNLHYFLKKGGIYLLLDTVYVRF